MPAKILIIEDDKFLSSVLKSRLEKEGFAVSQAFDGDSGISLARAEQPNLILLDLIMPKVSGFEVLQTLSMDPELNKIPVMVASNLGQESDIAKAKSLGAVNYYVKVRTSIDGLAQMAKQMTENPGSGSMPAEPIQGGGVPPMMIAEEAPAVAEEVSATAIQQ
jgi:DNA-binding response OmpR family regulator